MTSGGNFGANHDRRLWFVLFLLFAAVLLPTACILWLINDGISKQRQIASQQLADAYRSQLRVVSERLDEYWRIEAAKLARRVQTGKPQSAWLDIVTSQAVDSLVLYNASGQVLYPVPLPAPAPPSDPTPEWTRALQLEQRLPPENNALAAAAYGEIAAKTKDPATAARAIQAQVRCLRQSGAKAAAAAIIFDRFGSGPFRLAVDQQGRSIAADALLMAIQITSASEARRLRAAELLYKLLTDYETNSMPSAQRLFLMKEMQLLGLLVRLTSFPTLQAEELAARVVEIGSTRAFDGVLRPSGIKDLWTLGSQSGQIAILLRTASVKERIEKLIAAQPLPSHVRLAMLANGSETKDAIETIPAGAYLPEWRIGLFLADRQPFDDLASRQMGLYVWTGALVIAAVLCIAFVAGRVIHRQMRLANLKSDLVATVSHELKTPLASIRLLIDTLLQEDVLDPVRTREYLELMDRENTRLTQMIENFLAFSRLERNRYNFRFAEASPAEIVDRATEAFAERATEPGVRLNVEVAAGLPNIHADPGALSTALLNLLDNAYKYTPEDKRIDLRAFRNNGNICFEVQDNGIGVPKSEAAKVFRDFYRVDNRLARSQGGCGLGLSIVKFIVHAHKGTVSLDSRAGQGSTFKVAVPCSHV